MQQSDYPRPDFVRSGAWRSLNGSWEFAFDDEDLGLKEGWNRGALTLPSRITVPFCYQSAMSGIGDTSFHDILWYKRDFDLPGGAYEKKLFLRFGAVDY